MTERETVRRKDVNSDERRFRRRSSAGGGAAAAAFLVPASFRSGSAYVWLRLGADSGRVWLGFELCSGNRVIIQVSGSSVQNCVGFFRFYSGQTRVQHKK
ncbi:hypothetical protein HanIR_Chr12g0599101 [Helianthus annuus]|nr:hypothetical protein HanIR_Chr12g0599101 [Helianthus annuus]